MSKFQELEQCFHWTPEGKKQVSQMLESNKIKDRFQKEITESISQSNNPTLMTEKIERIFLDIARECLIPKKNVTMKQGQNLIVTNGWRKLASRQKEIFRRKRKNFSNFLEIWV